MSGIDTEGEGGISPPADVPPPSSSLLNRTFKTFFCVCDSYIPSRNGSALFVHPISPP